MARAYIVLARNDLDDNLLQVVDLVPNTSLRNFPYTPPGQTGYLTHFVQNDTVSTSDIGGGERALDSTVYGLAAYLVDNVEDTTGGNLSITDGNAANIADAILDRVAAGSSLTLADVNALIVAELGGGNDLEGTAGASTGSLEEVLRILAGEVYRVSEGDSISGAANAFAAAAVGAFVTPPNLIRAGEGAGGREFDTAPYVPPDAISQEEVDPARLLNAGVELEVPATADVNYRFIREIIDTPDLHRSVLLGNLSKLVDSNFSFQNPSFTYGAGGTALDVGGAVIPTDWSGRACVVYKADGTVI